MTRERRCDDILPPCLTDATNNGLFLRSGLPIHRPSFLPDPKDGSLYAVSPNLEPVKKLPFTIPELVTAAPCKSSEGVFYTGK